MCQEDISQVAEIDRGAFPSLWPPVNYQRELQNVLAHYLIACDEDRHVEPAAAHTSGAGVSAVVARVRQWFSPSRSPAKEVPATPRQYIVGFTGTWIVAGEAHIINIAVRELYRRQGIGELLLISTIDLAMSLKAHIVMLEVRASNTAAQALYRKYGFSQVGIRRGYYIDNKEDAILMSTEDIGSALFQQRLEQLRQAHSRKPGIALYRTGDC
jgi:ribosomal-protein-alanine N-acetyltransferase